jgi:adenine-specific DNA-methyltransferase
MKPAIRYMGSKRALLTAVADLITAKGIEPGRALDPFAGAGNVSRHLRSSGFTVEGGDILTFSYVILRKYLETDQIPEYSQLLADAPRGQSDGVHGMEQVIDYLNNGLPVCSGFVTEQYSAPIDSPGSGRMYFTGECPTD